VKMKKKIKNPEKFIKKLKDQIEDLERYNGILRRERDRARGVAFVTWRPHEASQSTLDWSLATINPGQKIAIIGRVKKVEKSMNLTCANRGSQIIYEVLETRKVD